MALDGSNYSHTLTRDEPSIIDFSVLPDIGCLTHVVFDKTDTLTTSHLEIMRMSTSVRCYKINCWEIQEKLTEIKTPGNNLALNESLDGADKEMAEYSEKSQEYLAEIEGDFKAEVFDETENWTEMIRGLEQPSYNLEIAD